MGKGIVIGMNAMAVKARLKRREKTLHRDRRSGTLYAARHRRPPETSTGAHAEAVGVRQGGPSQDQALYSCQCGMVFEALVSTSVGCPHCGSSQAW